MTQPNPDPGQIPAAPRVKLRLLTDVRQPRTWFDAYRAALRFLPGHRRMRVFHALPVSVQDFFWRDLARRLDEERRR
jgi:hypothetical protein